MMNDDDLEENISNSVTKVHSPRLPAGGTDESDESLSQDTSCLGRQSNPAPPEYKSKAIPIRRFAA
jgi:hypothetical protein